MGGEAPEGPACGGKLATIISARRLYSYGELNDYWDDANCLGWIRRGTEDKPHGLAVVMSNKGPGRKHMFVGEVHAGEEWTDCLGWNQDVVKIDEGGWGDFTCPGHCASIWVYKEANGREDMGEL